MTRKVVLDQFHLSKWKTTFTFEDNENTVMILFIGEKKVSVRENCWTEMYIFSKIFLQFCEFQFCQQCGRTLEKTKAWKAQGSK
jgi:hypothetical protein